MKIDMTVKALNTDFLDEVLDHDYPNKDVCLMMSRSTLLVMDENYGAVLVPKEEGYAGNYIGYEIYIDDDLPFGTVDIR